MNKKFAVVKIHKNFGTFLRVIERLDFETLMKSVKIDVLFESDNYMDASNMLQEYKSSFDDITHV